MIRSQLILIKGNQRASLQMAALEIITEFGDGGCNFARCESGKRLLPLMCSQLRRPTELDAASCARLRPSPVRARISSRSNSATPPRTSTQTAISHVPSLFLRARGLGKILSKVASRAQLTLPRGSRTRVQPTPRRGAFALHSLMQRAINPCVMD
jgi:hypothetical protein